MFRESHLFLFFTFFGEFDCVSTVVVEPERWTHLAVTVDAQGQPTLFVNGRPVPTLIRFEKDGLPLGALPETWTPLNRRSQGSVSCLLGRNPKSSTNKYPAEQWQGLMDGVAVFDRVLVADEILKHFEAGRVGEPINADSS